MVSSFESPLHLITDNWSQLMIHPNWSVSNPGGYLATLVEHGVGKGSQLVNLNHLAAAVYRHGGQYSIDFADGSYRVVIREQTAKSKNHGSEGFGDTAEEALGVALAAFLNGKS